MRFNSNSTLKKVRLSNCCEIIGGYAFDSKKMSTKEGTFQVIKMGNVYNGILDLSRNTSYISNPTNNELVSLLKEKDIIITLTGTVNKKDYGYSVQIENQKNLLLNQRCALIRATNINDEYLFYLIKSKHFLDQFYSSSTGGTGNQTNVSIKAMEQFKVSIHSEEEQEKIAYLLKKIDIRISTQNKIIECKLSQMNYISNVIFSSLKECCPLNQFVKFGKAGGTPKSTIKQYYNGDIPFLSITDINNQGKYITEATKSITQEGLKNSSAWIVPKNSLILSMYASVGFPTINKIDLATSQAMFAMVLNDEDDLDFLYYYLLYFQQNKLNKLLETGTQSNINADTVRAIPIPIFTKQEKQFINKTLNSIYNNIEIEKDILYGLKKQKEYLLRNMFI